MRFKTLLLVSLSFHLGFLLLSFDLRPARKPIVITALTDIYSTDAPGRTFKKNRESSGVSLPKRSSLSKGEQGTIGNASSKSASISGTPVLNLKEIISLGNEPPEYPQLALDRGHEGIVRLRISRNADGRVGEVHVSHSSGFAILDRAAIEAAREWKLGTEGPQAIVVPVRFRIEPK